MSDDLELIDHLRDEIDYLRRLLALVLTGRPDAPEMGYHMLPDPTPDAPAAGPRRPQRIERAPGRPVRQTRPTDPDYRDDKTGRLVEPRRVTDQPTAIT